MQRESSLIVEFVGLPGAGKTTVYRSLLEQLQTVGVSFVSRDQMLFSWRQLSLRQRFWQLQPQHGRHWQVLIQALKLAAQVKPLNRTSFLKAATLFANVKRIDENTCTSHPQLVLLDQGCLQEIWSIQMTDALGMTASGEDSEIELSVLHRRLTPLLTALLTPDSASEQQNRAWAVVHVKTELEVAVDRIQQRSSQSSRFDRMQTAAAQALLIQQAPRLQLILDSVRTYPIPVLEVDGSLPIEVTVDQIKNWILDLIEVSENSPRIAHPSVQTRAVFEMIKIQ